MKLESLYNKKIDLKESRVFGGSSTQRETERNTKGGGTCGDQVTTIHSDSGQFISECTINHNCE